MRIKTTFGITTFALLPFLMASCSSDDSPATGSYTINATGGLGGSGTAGNGGDGDYVDMYKEAGLGNVEMLRSGQANASFASSTPSTDLGDNPLTITANTTIAVLAAEPAAGVAYFVANNSNIYISDGNTTLADEDPVTGMSIASGATLTLELNQGGATYAEIYLTNDLRNSGTITTDDADANNRGDLYLYPDTYVGTSGSSIDTSTTTASMNGGYVEISVDGNIFNHGSITTSGGDAADGGSVYLNGNYNLQNTAAIDTQGGANGGNGGYIYLYGNYGYAYNSGDLTTNGGSGTGAGGGGDVYLESYLGDLLNSGDVITAGGDSSTGGGGSGGYFYLYSYTGKVINSGDLMLHGGSTTFAGSNGGDGGYVYMESNYNGSIDGYDHAPQDVLMSGNIDTSGGDSLATGDGDGGNAGYVELYSYNGGYVTNDSRVAFLNYSSVDTSGGDGGISGGDAGDIGFQNEYAWDDGTYDYISSGDVINQANITARGGNALVTTQAAIGGLGGDINFETAYYSGWTAPDLGKVKNTGTIDISGGNKFRSSSTSQSRSGYVWFWGFNGVTNSAAITANGGNDGDTDGGIDGYGGYANDVSMYAELGSITNTAAVTVNGGDGEYRGGYSDGIYMYGTTVSNTGNLTANGGDADDTLAGSIGGYGGWIELFSIDGPAGVSYSGTASHTGGAGTTPGNEGSLVLAGMCTGLCD